MIIALALGLQEPPITPMPEQMEAAFNAYGACLYAQITSKADMLIGVPGPGPSVFEAAREACLDVRERSILASDASLATLPAFADPAERRAFIAGRFDGFDQLMRETADGGMDPDNWEQ